jgi:hypothetical protein
LNPVSRNNRSRRKPAAPTARLYGRPPRCASSATWGRGLRRDGGQRLPRGRRRVPEKRAQIHPDP